MRREGPLDGPWWWRLRCVIADAALRVGGWLDPEDRGSRSVPGERPGWIRIERTRRREASRWRARQAARG